MKCEHCPALKKEGYEYPEYYCAVYPEDECVEFKDGSLGCYHRIKTIKKLLEQYDEYRDHQWDGFAEWYEADQKLEFAVKAAIKEACDIENLSFAYKDVDGNLFEANMKDEIPSALHDFVFRFRCSLEAQGYEIKLNESTKQEEENEYTDK